MSDPTRSAGSGRLAEVLATEEMLHPHVPPLALVEQDENAGDDGDVEDQPQDSDNVIGVTLVGPSRSRESGRCSFFGRAVSPDSKKRICHSKAPVTASSIAITD